MHCFAILVVARWHKQHEEALWDFEQFIQCREIKDTEDCSLESCSLAIWQHHMQRGRQSGFCLFPQIK